MINTKYGNIASCHIWQCRMDRSGSSSADKIMKLKIALPCFLAANLLLAVPLSSYAQMDNGKHIAHIKGPGHKKRDDKKILDR